MPEKGDVDSPSSTSNGGVLMNSKVKAAILAAIGIVAVDVGGPALADPGHGRAHGSERYYPGPGNSRIPYTTGYYMNSQRRRTSYTYPQDYRRYGRPLNWDQGHSNWYKPQHRDWYRGANH